MQPWKRTDIIKGGIIEMQIDMIISADYIDENIIKEVYQVEGLIGKDEDEIYFIPRKVC